jgi:aspartate ammonia-lyase
MTGDLLLYSSSLSGEITHAHLIYGSTIMAGKSNPVLLEYIQGLSVEVRAQADMVIRHCREGQLQLNARLPFIISGFLKVCDDLEVALKTMTDKLLPSMQPDLSTIDKKLYGSSALIQALKPWLSYDKIKEIFTMLKQQEHPPRNKESWILFLQEVGGLTPQFLETQGFQKSFLQDFLNSPGLTGFYRKEL